MNGWIKLHRKLTEWEWYNDSSMVHLFIHLLLNASNRDCKWKGVDVKRGQVVVGRKKLSADTGISEKTVRTCLNRLKSASVTASKATNKYTIVTILNYDEYQICDNTERPADGPADGPTKGQQRASKGPAKGHIVRSKEGKEGKKEDMSSGNDARQRIPYSEIVSFLNEKVKGNFKATTNSTKTKIKARWNEGFTLEDFKTVIERKADEWLTDQKMVQYLRPETLFGTKFEGYLQAAENSAANARQSGDRCDRCMNNQGAKCRNLVKPPAIDGWTPAKCGAFVLCD